MVRGGLTATFLAALLLAPAASATLPIEGTVAAHGPTTLIGTNRLVADLTGLLYAGPLLEGQDLHVTGTGLRAVYLNVPTTEVRLNASPEPIAFRQPGEPVVLASAVPDALTFLADDSPSSTLRFLGSDAPLGLDLSGAARLEVQPGGPSRPTAVEPAYGGATSVEGHASWPTTGGGTLVALSGSALAANGAFHAFLQGGLADAGAGPWRTGRWLNESASAVDPLTGSGRLVHDNRFVLLTGNDLALRSAGSPVAWDAAVRSLGGAFDGDIAWTGVEARLHAGGKPLEVDPELVHVRGRLQLDAGFDGPSRWSLRGEADFLALDGGPSLAPAVAVAAGVSLVAALAALFVLGRNRLLTKAAPLRSRSRRRILTAIHDLQPVRAPDLERATGLSRTTLAYHLRVLLSYEVIQSRSPPDGRNTTFMLNSGSLLFPVEAAPEDGPAALAAQALAAANSHPLRRALYEAVRDHGPLDAEGLVAALRRQGRPAPPRSSLAYHLDGLVEQGALVASRAGRRIAYRATLHDGEARVVQYRRFLGQMKALDAVRAMHAQPRSADDLGKGRKAVDHLCDLGLARRDPSDGRYRLDGLLTTVAGRL